MSKQVWVYAEGGRFKNTMVACVGRGDTAHDAWRMAVKLFYDRAEAFVYIHTIRIGVGKEGEGEARPAYVLTTPGTSGYLSDREIEIAVLAFDAGRTAK